MKIDVVHGREAAARAAIGVVGALIFLFAFPKGSISTLMHEVFDLPGPGAGIVLILGPFLILITIIASRLGRGDGGAVITSLTFAAAYALIVWGLEIPTNPKGAFGSTMFIAAVALFGIAAEVILVLGKALRSSRRCMLAGTLANAVLCVFYWVLIFPRTAKWIAWGDVPLLLGLCLVSGLVSGFIACAVSGPLVRAFAAQGEGVDHVRPR